MSLDLKDLKRVKLTADTLAWLESESRETNRSKQEILRDEMHAIAVAAKRKARLLLALSPDEGSVGDSQGHRGTGRK
jgi:hypothetical protein